MRRLVKFRSYRVTVVLLVVCLSYSSRSAVGAPVECTPTQLTLARKASAEAQKALMAAATAIDSEDPQTINRLGRWLGVVNTTQARAVATRLRVVSTWLSKAVYRCENQTNIRIGDVYAYVDPKLGLTITLGAFFFSSPDSGVMSTKLGVLVHEASHFAIAGATKDPKVYGPDEALRLVNSSPAEAQANAENIEYFVESFYFKLDP